MTTKIGTDFDVTSLFCLKIEVLDDSNDATPLHKKDETAVVVQVGLAERVEEKKCRKYMGFTQKNPSVDIFLSTNSIFCILFLCVRF